MIGTVKWGAPETFEYPPLWTPKADIYSLGVTFYEIASRKVPFEEVIVASPPHHHNTNNAIKYVRCTLYNSLDNNSNR